MSVSAECWKLLAVASPDCGVLQLDGCNVSSPHTTHTQLTPAISRIKECWECRIFLRQVCVSEEDLFDLGLVLSSRS